MLFRGCFTAIQKIHLHIFKSFSTSEKAAATNLKVQNKPRKDKNLSPDRSIKSIPAFCPEEAGTVSGRTPFFISLFQASLTVEAALALPVFFLCMMMVIQYGNVCSTAARMSTAMAQTSEEIAIGAYATAYGDEDDSSGVVLPALTDAYAHTRTVYLLRKSSANNRRGTSSIRNLNFACSRFLENDDMIEITAAYRVRPAFGIVSYPGNFFIQRACTRGWTGRAGSGGEGGEGDGDPGNQTVYVTEHGTVYHTDPDCTHIKLSIRGVDRSIAEKGKNIYGEKYHPCEICGGGGELVYITPNGNRYHSSLHCSGLKRTVHEKKLKDVEGMKPCSKCAGE